VNVLKLIVGLLLAALLVVVGAQNTQSVTFRFIVWETPAAPVALGLAIAVVIGVLLSWIVSVPGRIHGMRQRRSLQHEVDAHARIIAAGDHAEATTPGSEPRS
jgi:uncharacterized integral membrane protein